MAIAKKCSTVASNKLKDIFLVLEDVSGVLQRPTPEGYILPAGDPTLTQTPTYTDSEELSGTPDIIEQFKNAVEAGEASVPMYVRLEQEGRLQGDDAFTALMGNVQERSTVTATVDATAGLDTTATEIPVSAVSGGILPRRGIVTIGDEKIRYTEAELDADDQVVALKNCTRGFGGTTPADIEDGATLTLTSKLWFWDNCRPSVSIWLRVDHTVFFARNAKVSQCTIPMSKSGGQHADFTFSFAQMGWVGRSFLTSVPVGGVLTVETEDGTNAFGAYCVGGIIKNTTRNDDNGGAGYTITAIDEDLQTVTVSPAPTGWAEGDRLDPWLPAGMPIGKPLEAAEMRVFVGGKSGKLTEGTITLGTPVAYTSEIGDEFPGESADNTRALTMDNGLYFRAKDVVEFRRGYDGYDMPVDVVMGNKSGRTLSLVMPRVKFQAPTMATEEPFVTLTRTGAIMGTKGNDSLYIVQE